MSRVKRYQDPEVYERLAGEYVLGTLRGGALRRFERLMHERPYIRYAVESWEDRLNPLAEQLPDVTPEPRVWKAISKGIKASGYAHEAESVLQGAGSKGTGFWQSLGLWRAATAILSLLLAVTVLMPQLKHDSMPMPTYVAVLKSDAKIPMMVTMGDQDKRMVSVRIMEMPEVGEDQDIQLWAMREYDEGPMPVGILRRDVMETQLSFSRQQWQENIKGATMFAVTFEPKGGSPSGQPSGKIMYKGACLDFI